ncbi:MAG: hypothetical protein LUD52_06540 [Opitutae bacterium]|nr:hypothetical protein [Opitutae bacterium]
MSDPLDFDPNSQKTVEQLRAELERADLEKARLQIELESEALRSKLGKTQVQTVSDAPEQPAEPEPEPEPELSRLAVDSSQYILINMHKKTDPPLPFRGVPLLPPDEIERLKQESDKIAIAREQFCNQTMVYLFWVWLLVFVAFVVGILVFGPPDIDWSFLNRWNEKKLKSAISVCIGFGIVCGFAYELGKWPWKRYAKEHLEEMVLFGEKETTAKTPGEIARANMILELGKGEVLAKLVEEANARADAMLKKKSSSATSSSPKNTARGFRR